MAHRLDPAHFEDRWEDYLAGALDPAATVELEGHLASCAACREAVDEARAASRLLRAVLDPAPAPRLGFWTRVRAGIEAELSPAGADFWASLELLARRLTLVSAAALLLLGVYVAVDEFDPVNRWGRVQVENLGVLPEPAPQPLDSDDVLLAVTGQVRYANGNGNPNRSR